MLIEHPPRNRTAVIPCSEAHPSGGPDRASARNSFSSAQDLFVIIASLHGLRDGAVVRDEGGTRREEAWRAGCAREADSNASWTRSKTEAASGRRARALRRLARGVEVRCSDVGSAGRLFGKDVDSLIYQRLDHGLIPFFPLDDAEKTTMRRFLSRCAILDPPGRHRRDGPGRADAERLRRDEGPARRAGPEGRLSQPRDGRRSSPSTSTSHRRDRRSSRTTGSSPSSRPTRRRRSKIPRTCSASVTCPSCRTTSGTRTDCPSASWARGLRGRKWLGLTCAACHTIEIRYKDTGYRVDGAPTHADVDAMLSSMIYAMQKTMDDSAKFQRFAAKVLVKNGIRRRAETSSRLSSPNRSSVWLQSPQLPRLRP